MYNKILVQTSNVFNKTVRFNIMGVNFKQSRKEIYVGLLEVVLV